MTGLKLLMSPALLIVLLFSSATVNAQENNSSIRSDGQQTWVVNDYRYVPGSTDDDPNIGHSLCGTRCNAMTSDYRNVIEPGGWRLIRIAENRELTVELNNPFIGGHCICIADEYLVKIDEFNRPEKTD